MFSEAALLHARTLFPHTVRGKVYLNHAATSPLSTRVLAAMAKHLEERSTGAIDTYHGSDLPTYARCRESVARMINAESADRIALLGNTSEAINIVASGLQWNPGDRILLHREEFPANVYPYLNLKRQGVELDLLTDPFGFVSPETVEHALTPRTRLVGLSAVQFLSGYRADLAAIGELCRRKEVLFVVDGIQAVGAICIDVQGMHIDALAAGCQKWQMSPHGTAFLYVTEELQSRIRLHHLGWLAVEQPFDFFNYEQPLASSARRYEGGTRNVPGLYGMAAALSTLLEFGMTDIESHVLDLTEMLTDRLCQTDGVRLISPDSRNRRAGIVTIQPPPGVDAERVFTLLQERNIAVALRSGSLRYSPHFYNTPAEITLAVEATKEFMGNMLR